MNKIIKRFKTNNDIDIILFRSSSNGRFGICNYDTVTRKYEHTTWIINYQKAIEEVRNRINDINGDNSNNVKTLKEYTINDWNRDKGASLKIGQNIDENVFEELKKIKPIISYSLRCFQMGNSIQYNNVDTYHTFSRINGYWKYLGLCKKGETHSLNSNNINENKQEIRITEDRIKDIIEESIKKIINNKKAQ